MTRFQLPQLAASIFIVVVLFNTSLAADDAPEYPVGLFETAQMERLQSTQNRAGATISEFSTDGCSGGLSEGWKKLGQLIPGLATKIGEVPWWNSCCVDHDRVYWRGETNDGYSVRLRADAELRRCVVQSGEKVYESLRANYSVTQKQVDDALGVVGDLMFLAVRAGGLPCSGLSWRWGYGWPNCD